MQIGSIVKKVTGASMGKTGMVLEIANEGKKGFEILTVLVDGAIQAWAKHLTEVEHEDCNCEQH